MRDADYRRIATINRNIVELGQKDI